LRREDLEVIHQSINELINGIGISDVKIRLGASAEEVENFEQKIKGVLDTADFSKGEVNIEWSCIEMQLSKSLLCELLKGLDHFEFETRLGFNEESVWAVLKTVREHLDVICYPKR
ncbi:hypothetical protein IT396_02900, partial [Candidatus Nomurabacteria bacterium]|nr:hypothetical protein [Candidatus Nomurabacteria bacterium]